MSHNFNLYSSEGCHLCEQALEICLSITDASNIKVIDIVEDDKLVELYGVHIPVVERLNDNAKLFWPFSAQDFKELL